MHHCGGLKKELLNRSRVLYWRRYSKSKLRWPLSLFLPSLIFLERNHRNRAIHGLLYLLDMKEKIKVTIMGDMYESTLKVNFLIKYIQVTWKLTRNVTNTVFTTFKHYYLIKTAIFYISLSPIIIRACIPGQSAFLGDDSTISK